MHSCSMSQSVSQSVQGLSAGAAQAAANGTWSHAVEKPCARFWVLCSVVGRGHFAGRNNLLVRQAYQNHAGEVAADARPHTTPVTKPERAALPAYTGAAPGQEGQHRREVGAAIMYKESPV